MRIKNKANSISNRALLGHWGRSLASSSGSIARSGTVVVEEETGLTATENLASGAQQTLRNELGFQRRVLSAWISDGDIATTSDAGLAVVPYGVGGVANMSILANNFNSGTNRFTALWTGGYHFDAYLYMAKNGVANDFNVTQFACFKNDSVYKVGHYQAVNSEDGVNLRAHGLVWLEVGEWIDIRYRAGTPTAPVSVQNEYGYFDVHYVGCNGEDTGNIKTFTI